MTDPLAPPGWYPDPGNPYAQPYFDGTNWTDHQQVPVTPRTESRQRVTWVVVAAVAALSVVTLLLALLPGTGRAKYPTPEQPIAGPSITLPTALFLANGKGAQPLVTPQQAARIVPAMWHMWETALIHRDTKALTQLVPAGSFLQAMVYQCTWPASPGSYGGCVAEHHPRALSAFIMVIPAQYHYPLDFLVEIQTTEWIQDSQGAPSRWAPWLELQILTKHDAKSPWQLSFDTGYRGTNDLQPPWLPIGPPIPPGYDPRPTGPGPVASNQYLRLLASYWESWKRIGAAPANSPFISDAFTSGFGQDLASSPDDTLHQYSFSVDSQAGAWTFSASGFPMVCGTVVDHATTLSSGGALVQNATRTNWGMPLAPGLYNSITNNATHLTCVYVVKSGLDAVGNSGSDASVTGARISALPPP